MKGLHFSKGEIKVIIMILSDKDLKKNLMGTKKGTISYICQDMRVTTKCKSEFGDEKS